jgi:membrane protein
MLHRLGVPVGWGEILTRTVKEAYEDNCLGMAAQLAYYFFLALFPALLFLVALASFFPVQDLMTSIVGTLGQFAPPEVLEIVRDQLRKIAEGEQGGLLTFAFLFTLWSSSAAMVSIIETLNQAYDVVESRPIWKTRALAIGLTVGVAFFILVSFALVLVGPTLAENLAGRMGLGDAFEWTWKILQWPVVIALVAFAIAIIYYFAPDVEQEWVYLTPGSIFATILWLLCSLAFKLYLANFTDYTATYGAIGGVIVMMLWFYLGGLAVLIGAEMNAEIEHASAWGKDPGERAPGQKVKIGAVAERDYGERQRAIARGIKPAPETGPNCTIEPPTTRAPRPMRPRFSELVLGSAMIAAIGLRLKALAKPSSPER